MQQRFQEWEFQDKRYVIIGPVSLPIAVRGEQVIFRWYSFSQIEGKGNFGLNDLVELSKTQNTSSSILVYGDFEEAEAPLLRIHSVCQTGDVFGSLRCDCGPQLKNSLEKIVDARCGALLYLANQEGRGIGLLSKAITYLIQEEGVDTFEANRKIGCGDDERTYEDAGAILHFLRDGHPISLLTNNPAKIAELEKYGVSVKKRYDATTPAQKYNRFYMETKVKSGHLSDEQILGIVMEG